MASVNKQSLRAEFDAFEARFRQLVADGRMTSESRALFEGLLTLFRVLMAVFMEKHTVKTRANSSLPSSRSPTDDTAVDRPGSRGKGKSLDHARSANTRTVETAEVSKVVNCEHCGEDLRRVRSRTCERRTRIDIVFEKVIEHVDAEIKHCPHCHEQTRAPFPTAFAGPLQYGAGIRAYALHLLMAQMISLKRVQQSIQTLIGLAIAEATLLKYVMQLHQALARWEHAAIEQLLALPALHVDETSLRVERKNHWIHVCSGGEITLKFVHPKRGLEAIEAIGVIPRYGGVIIHDCWASYLSYDHCEHGLCGAHLLRELSFIVEANQYRWAQQLRALLQQTCQRVRECDDKRLDAGAYAALQKRYRTILTRGSNELPVIPPRQDGKRGRVAKSDAHNLHERLVKHEQAILLFACNPDVPFTNNRAERDLRMSKVKQKISGCFRNRDYAEAYCRISSYLQTMANKGYNPLVAIQIALSGQLYLNPGGE